MHTGAWEPFPVMQNAHQFLNLKNEDLSEYLSAEVLAKCRLSAVLIWLNDCYGQSLSLWNSKPWISQWSLATPIYIEMLSAWCWLMLYRLMAHLHLWVLRSRPPKCHVQTWVLCWRQSACHLPHCLGIASLKPHRTLPLPPTSDLCSCCRLQWTGIQQHRGALVPFWNTGYRYAPLFDGLLPYREAVQQPRCLAVKLFPHDKPGPPYCVSIKFVFAMAASAMAAIGSWLNEVARAFFGGHGSCQALAMVESVLSLYTLWCLADQAILDSTPMPCSSWDPSLRFQGDFLQHALLMLYVSCTANGWYHRSENDLRFCLLPQ